MSKLARAIEILEAINQHFQEHDGQTVLYSDAQILDGDITIKDAIAECLGEEEETKFTVVIPRSQRRNIGINFYNHWVGFIGRRKDKDFGPDGEESKRLAYEWLHEELHEQ